MTTELESSIVNLHRSLEELAKAVLDLVEASRKQLRETEEGPDKDPEPKGQMK